MDDTLPFLPLCRGWNQVVVDVFFQKVDQTIATVGWRNHHSRLN